MTPHEANYPVADNICRLMQEQDIEAYWVAYNLGQSKSEFSLILGGGGYIRSCDIPKLAKLFCVPMEELFRPVEGRKE